MTTLEKRRVFPIKIFDMKAKGHGFDSFCMKKFFVIIKNDFYNFSDHPESFFNDPRFTHIKKKKCEADGVARSATPSAEQTTGARWD